MKIGELGCKRMIRPRIRYVIPFAKLTNVTGPVFFNGRDTIIKKDFRSELERRLVKALTSRF